MGLSVTEDATASAANPVADEAEEENEESIVHQTASVGDVEVLEFKYTLFCYVIVTPISFESSLSTSRMPWFGILSILVPNLLHHDLELFIRY